MAVLDVQAGFRKGGIRDQIANIRWIIEKVREFQKSIYLCFINYAKAFDYVDHNKLWRALKEMGIPGHLTRLLRNLYMGQEATVTTLYGTTDWFKIEKRERQGCLLSPCLFNLYPEHIMKNAGLDELQVGFKIGGRDINNLRYAYDTTLMADHKKELKSLLMRVKEESERAVLKLILNKLRSWHPAPFSSVQFSHSLVSDSLRPHESQHARPSCPSPTPGVHPDPHPSSQ